MFGDSPDTRRSDGARELPGLSSIHRQSRSFSDAAVGCRDRRGDFPATFGCRNREIGRRASGLNRHVGGHSCAERMAAGQIYD